MGKRISRKLIVAGLVLAVLVLCAIMLIVVYTNFLETSEIGYGDVYLTNLRVKTEVYGISFLMIFVIFFLNIFFFRRNMDRKGVDTGPFKSAKNGFLITLFMAVVWTLLTSGNTSSLFLLFKNSLPFNNADPIFGSDIGYYVFQRPFLKAIGERVSGILLFQIIYTALLYSFFYLKRDISTFSEILTKKSIIVHNMINVVVYLGVLAVSFKFTAENILFGNLAGLKGAGFTDIFVWLRYYRVAPFLLMLVVLITVFMVFRGRTKGALITMGAVPAVWIVAFIAALAVEIAFVKPYEISVEQRFVNYNIEATREGFGLDEIVERIFPADNELTSADIKESAGTIQNISTTDPSASLAAANSVQTYKNYYTFYDNDVVAYNIDGKLTGMSVAVREMDQKKLEDAGKSYINSKLRYTHGYGLVMNPVNTLTKDGQPQFLIKDIPIDSYGGAPHITQPRIYFGELTNDYVVVNSTYKEMDYTEGSEEVEYVYKGEAGIPLNYLNRTLFALRNGDFLMILSGYTKPESKILTNRNIIDRAKAAAPFLEYDDDPYIVISASGRLKWVVDAYTSTDYYPYSQSYGGRNYIRNSAKVIIDAYDGTTDFYITDPSDPIIMVYNRMYPGLFKEEGLPWDIAERVKYPEKLFNIQAEVYKRYHVTRADNLLSNSDLWVGAKQKSASGDVVDLKPYYTVTKIEGVGSRTEELVLMQPFTPAGKENMVALLAARPGLSDYRKLIVYKFPAGRTVFGPLYIENKIEKDSAISRELALLGEGGSTVFKGNMLVLPIKNSLLYVKPIYVTTKNAAAVPEVKNLIVAYDNEVVMEATIERALNVLVGAQKPTFEGDEKTLDDLVRESIERFNAMRNFGREGDYENFGTSLAALEETMDELERMQNPEETPVPEN